MGIKLSYAISLVLLDKKWHTEQEIVNRVSHFVSPQIAVRLLTQRIKFHRHVHRIKRNHAARLEDPLPEKINVEKAIAFAIHRCLEDSMKAANYIERSEDRNSWRLTDYGKKSCGGPLKSGSIAKVVITNLLLRGELV